MGRRIRHVPAGPPEYDAVGPLLGSDKGAIPAETHVSVHRGMDLEESPGCVRGENCWSSQGVTAEIHCQDLYLGRHLPPFARSACQFRFSRPTGGPFASAASRRKELIFPAISLKITLGSTPLYKSSQRPPTIPLRIPFTSSLSRPCRALRVPTCLSFLSVFFSTAHIRFRLSSRSPTSEGTTSITFSKIPNLNTPTS